jgi:PRC-barrel domain
VTILYENIVDWRDKQIFDRDGDKIGKLKDVYVDVETDEPMFGSVKEGFVGRQLTFVPLDGSTLTPDSLQVTVSKEEVHQAPNIERDGDELSQDDERALYHHYEFNYTPPGTPRGRRLARR